MAMFLLLQQKENQDINGDLCYSVILICHRMLVSRFHLELPEAPNNNLMILIGRYIALKPITCSNSCYTHTYIHTRAHVYYVYHT